MPRSKGTGIVGEPFKEAWLPEAEKMRHDEEQEKYRKSLPPKVRKSMVSLPYRGRWVSIGVAPTAEQVADNDYGGSA